MTPCEQSGRISDLEKQQHEQTLLLTEIRDLLRCTDTAIRGDASRGLVGIVGRQDEHGRRLDAIESTLVSYENRKWYFQGAVWAAGLVAGASVWLIEKLFNLKA